MKLFAGGMLAVCCLLLSGMPIATAQSQSGSVTVGGIVPGIPPGVAPVIEVPVNNTTFKQKLIDISGTCIEGLVVKVFRNNIFAGSTLCQADKTFALQADLTEDRNDLTARQYDLLSQPSPESDPVTVFFVPEATQVVEDPILTPKTAHFQLVIDYDYNFQGIFINEPFNLPIHFIGGAPPYAVSVNWGDGDTSVESRQDGSQFYVEHTYKKAGPQTVQIRISDGEGQEAFLQFVLIVNGGPVAALPLKGSDGTGGDNNSQTVWNAVLFSSLATGTASFTAGFLLATFWDTMRIKIKGKPKIKF